MKQQSKLISLLLRHNPDLADLTVARGGWVYAEELLKGLARLQWPMTLAQLHELVATSDKKRFTLSADGRQIRAAQGHSIEVDLDLSPSKPPEVLYHGTATRSLDAINAEGILPQSRQQVHLSSDYETAVKVGARHGKVVVLRVQAGVMYEQGMSFYQADNGVWPTDIVPSDYLG